jgi:hypothetical protein
MLRSRYSIMSRLTLLSNNRTKGIAPFRLWSEKTHSGEVMDIDCTRAARSSSSVTMTWSAPSALSWSLLAEVRVVAMEIPPCALTIWMAASPTDELGCRRPIQGSIVRNQLPRKPTVARPPFVRLSSRARGRAPPGETDTAKPLFY